MQFSAKYLQNNRILGVGAPPQENPGSTTDVDLPLHVVLNNGGAGFKPQPIFAKLENKFKKMFQIRKSRIFLVLKLGK